MNKIETDEENYYGLLLTKKENIPVIAMEGGSMYLSKKMALKIYKENPNDYILISKDND